MNFCLAQKRILHMNSYLMSPNWWF